MIEWEPIIVFPSTVPSNLPLQETIEAVRDEAQAIKVQLEEGEDLSINNITSTDFCDGVIMTCDYLLEKWKQQED